MGKARVSVFPLSFGEIGIKERVIRMKKFKRPSLVFTCMTLFIGIVISVCFLTNPKEKRAVDDDTKNYMGVRQESMKVKSKFDVCYKAIVETDFDSATDVFVPTLDIDTENETFCFMYDALSSYMSVGTYEEKADKIILITDDKRYHYTFKKGKGNNLYFCKDASSPVTLIDSRFGIELKDGTLFETVPQRNSDSVMTLEVKPVSVDLTENTGADGAMLYYVDAKIIIFGGSFGLFIYNKDTGRIDKSLDLNYIGCNQTQGDNYCEIAVARDGQKIYLNPKEQKKLYTYDYSLNILQVQKYQKSDIWKDSSLDLFRIKDTKEVHYQDGSEEKVCRLHEYEFVIGNCSYYEYSCNKPNDEKEPIYHPLFLME